MSASMSFIRPTSPSVEARSTSVATCVGSISSARSNQGMAAVSRSDSRVSSPRSVERLDPARIQRHGPVRRLDRPGEFAGGAAEACNLGPQLGIFRRGGQRLVVAAAGARSSSPRAR